MQVTFHFDPTCPWTWVTSRWLLRAGELEDLEVRWAPFSLPHLQGDADLDDATRRRFAAATAATRVVQHLADRGDHDAAGRFYEAFGDRVHRGGEPPSVVAVTGAVAAAGLDGDATAAAGDASLDEAVGATTDAAMEAAGPDVGSPILRWDDEGTDVWVFGPLFDRVPEAPCAAELWRGVRHLAVHAMFKELKRGRSGHPDVTSG